jgi:hypothetical protein
MASSCDFRRYSANCLAFAENVSILTTKLA